jgi:hypothetical protein
MENMVLDPLSAISLAGSIVQFVEFAGKVVLKAVRSDQTALRPRT